MIVCLCLDDREGLFFNHRRQSRDRAVLQDMGETVGQGRLWVHPYSLPLFAGWKGDLRVDENFLNLAGPGEYCFAEGQLFGALQGEAGVPGAVPLEPPVPRGCLL